MRWTTESFFDAPDERLCYIGAESLAIASLAGSALSAGVGAVGAIQQSSAASAAANYNAAVARNNQTLADQNARYAEAAGEEKSQVQDFKTRAAVGEALAGEGASGLDVGTGSPTKVRSSINQAGRLDALTIMNNADLSAYGYKAQAANFGGQAALDTAQARSASSAGLFSVGASLLGGASSFGDKWLSYSLKGVPGFKMETS